MFVFVGGWEALGLFALALLMAKIIQIIFDHTAYDADFTRWLLGWSQVLALVTGAFYGLLVVHRFIQWFVENAK